MEIGPAAELLLFAGDSLALARLLEPADRRIKIVDDPANVVGAIVQIGAPVVLRLCPNMGLLKGDIRVGGPNAGPTIAARRGLVVADHQARLDHLQKLDCGAYMGTVILTCSR